MTYRNIISITFITFMICFFNQESYASRYITFSAKDKTYTTVVADDAILTSPHFWQPLCDQFPVNRGIYVGMLAGW